jgi:hypothetical protein
MRINEFVDQVIRDIELGTSLNRKDIGVVHFDIAVNKWNLVSSEDANHRLRFEIDFSKQLEIE